MPFPRLQPWVLTVSLLANGFLAGMLFVHDHDRRGPPPGPPPSPFNIIERMAEDLPAADARILRDVAHGLDMNQEESEEGAMHDRIRTLLLAESFDTQAFQDAITEFGKKRQNAGDRVGQVLVEALPKMSLQGRRILAEMGPPPKGPKGPPDRR